MPADLDKIARTALDVKKRALNRPFSPDAMDVYVLAEMVIDLTTILKQMDLKDPED